MVVEIEVIWMSYRKYSWVAAGSQGTQRVRSEQRHLGLTVWPSWRGVHRLQEGALKGWGRITSMPLLELGFCPRLFNFRYYTLPIPDITTWVSSASDFGAGG